MNMRFFGLTNLASVGGVPAAQVGEIGRVVAAVILSAPEARVIAQTDANGVAASLTCDEFTPAAGSLLLAFGVQSGHGNFSSITDTAGHTWAALLDGSGEPDGWLGRSKCYWTIATGEPMAATLALTQAAQGSMSMCIVEVSGADTAQPFAGQLEFTTTARETGPFSAELSEAPEDGDLVIALGVSEYQSRSTSEVVAGDGWTGVHKKEGSYKSTFEYSLQMRAGEEAGNVAFERFAGPHHYQHSVIAVAIRGDY